jgi:hypothetical protein
MICEATPTIFFELETSFFDDESFTGPAFADAVIHSIKRKPEKENEKAQKPININILQQLQRVPHFNKK